MRNKLRVIVLMGGKSPEHDVSLVSGREVVRHLNKDKYEVLPVIISPEGTKWQLKTATEILNLSPDGVGRKDRQELVKREQPLTLASQSIPPELSTKEKTVVFIVMHGPYGEDGTIQGMLELAGLPYTGAKVLASALGMNKIMFRKIIEKEKIPVPQYIVFDKKSKKSQILKKFKFPLVVKPSDQGSSVGVSIVDTSKELTLALGKAFSYSNFLLIEKYLPGIEITCGVLGNENPIALPVIEIRPKKEFFDYEAKYQAELCEEIVPARISKRLTKKVQDLAIKVYQAINCCGFGRVDMIISRGRPYVLEINTIPGLTPNSLFPKEARAAGISYTRLLDRLIELALEK